MTIKLIIGVIVAALTAVIIIGGIQRIGKVTSMLVPFMSLLFIIMSLIAIIIHFDQVLRFRNKRACKAGSLGCV